MRTSSKVATGLAAMTIGTIGIVGAANAADETDLATDDTVVSTPDGAPGGGQEMGPGDGHGMSHGRGGHSDGHRGGPGMGGAMAAGLAEALGLDEATVAEALAAVRAEVGPRGGASSAERPQPGTMHDEMTQALADELGVDVAEVESAFDEMQAEHQSERRAELETDLSDAVDAGTISQADADAVMRVHDAGVLGGPRH